VRTAGRRRRGSESSKDIGEDRRGGADDQRSLAPRSRLDPDPVPAAAPLPLPAPQRQRRAIITPRTRSPTLTIMLLFNISSWPPPSPSHIMTPPVLPLHCPLCPSHSTLTAPVTLYCGHTVCAKHVSHPSSFPQPHTHLPVLLRLTPCPLQGCTASPAAPPPLNIPSSSHVTFFPAVGHQPDHDASAFATIPDSRVDVTVNNLATIIHRYDQQPQAQSPQHIPGADSGSGSDSETDEEILETRTSSPTQAFIAGSSANTGEGPSSIPRQVSSDGSHQRPARMTARKRRRRRLLPPRRLDAPAQSADQFEKELLAELSCEICLTLYYQPITSPCQHVSLPIPLILILVDPSVILSDLLYKVPTPFLGP
jgi:hypothetical protein